MRPFNCSPNPCQVYQKKYTLDYLEEALLLLLLLLPIFVDFLKILLTVRYSALTKHKVVWSEDLSKGSRANRVHGAWFQINKDGSGNILPSCKQTNKITSNYATATLYFTKFITCNHKQEQKKQKHIPVGKSGFDYWYIQESQLVCFLFKLLLINYVMEEKQFLLIR